MLRIVALLSARCFRVACAFTLTRQGEPVGAQFRHKQSRRRFAIIGPLLTPETRYKSGRGIIQIFIGKPR